MDILNHTYKNLKHINFPYEIVNEINNVDYDYVTINNYNLKFYDMNMYRYFWYCLKRQNDLDTVQEKTSEVVNDTSEYIIFDGHFNIAGQFTYVEKNNHVFKSIVNRLKRKSDKAFWGNIVDDKILHLENKTEDVEYVSTPNENMETKVLVQPSHLDYDQAYFVYVDNEFKPKRNLEVFYIFKKEENKDLVFDSIISDTWIY